MFLYEGNAVICYSKHGLCALIFFFCVNLKTDSGWNLLISLAFFFLQGVCEFVSAGEMAVTIKRMSIIVATLGVLSFIFGVIAENKKVQ